MGAYSVDILAVGFFLLEWTVYAVTLEHTAYGRNSLSARMHAYREIWGTTVAHIRLWARCASVQPSGIAVVDLATEGVTDEKPSHRNHDRCRHGHCLFRQS